MKMQVKILVTVLCTLYSVLSHATSYTWNGTTSTAWATTTNWTPNGTPGSGDNVTVVSATNAPLYNGVAGVTNLTMTSGTLNLNGYTLNVTGTGTFNGGTVSNGKINATGTNTTVAGTIFNCKVRVVSTNLYLNGSVFNDSTYVEQTGSSSIYTTGGNKYNYFTEVVNSGTGTLLMCSASPYNPDTSNADIKFTKKSSGSLYAFRASPGCVANAKVIINCTTSAAGVFNIGDLNNMTFNGDVEINNPGGSTIRFGYSSGSNVTLASGKKIIIGSGGFSSGALLFDRFTQAGSTKQTFEITGTSVLTLNSNVVFNAPVDLKAGTFYINGAWFKDTARIEQTHGLSYCDGGNVFDGPATLINSNTNTTYPYFTTGVLYPDTFNNTLSVVVKGATSSQIIFGRNSSGTYFAKNVTLKCKSVSGNISLGTVSSSVSSCTLGVGAKLLIDTISMGSLTMRGFKQLGDTAQHLVLTGGSIAFNTATEFNAKCYFEAPNILLSGGKFNKKSTFIKTGGANNTGNGGNVFNDTVVIINNTNAGYLLMANSAPDTCNGDVHLKNSGTSHIYMNYNYPGVYNGNIYIAGAGTGNTYFGANTGVATLASGKSIIEDTDGFTAGGFILRNFTKNGTTAVNLNIGSAAITFSTNNTINGAVTVSAGAIYLNGTIFNSNVDMLQTGSVNVSGSGGNTFNGTFKVRNTGSGQFLMNSSASVSDIFNGDAEFINEATGTGGTNGHMFIAYQGPNMQFNGSKTIFTNLSPVDRAICIKQFGTCTFNSNIEVNNTSSGGGTVDFGTYSGNTTLASGKTITVGSLGFSTGSLQLRGFYQSGSTSQTITVTGSSYVWFRRQVNTTSNRSEFGGTVTVSAPRIYLNGVVFKDDASFTATGAFTVVNDGDNEYQGDFTFNNSGSGNKTFANVTRDIYKGDAIFSSSSGTFYIAHTGVNTFSGNITVNGSPSFYFGNGGGKVVMDGTGNHVVKKINGSVIRTFSLNEPGDYTSNFKNLLFTNDLMGRMWQPEN